eukprot:TRINITY_DN10824_c1_g1_i4.p1 TRINITY_DN10824_c1_g1~~TRINITY_DN10824_c1_g1_i4.p1  ORF type:complete len:265 (+),score=37.73 TRINITY_DN10824_c1_g1_i4:105-797(+)
MLERTPEHERDEEWSTQMKELKEELGIQEKPTEIKKEVDPQVRRRIKMLERTPEHERDDEWRAQMKELLPESDVRMTELPAVAAAKTQPSPAETAPIAPDSPKKQKSVTSMGPLDLLIKSFTLLNDINARTEFGFVSLCGSLLLSVVSPLHVFSLLFFAFHIFLFGLLLLKVGFQHPLWYFLVYVIRDYLPNLAIVLTVQAVLPTPAIAIVATGFGGVATYRLIKRSRVT